MHLLLTKFKQYFSISEINIDKKAVLVIVSASVFLLFGEYYDSTHEVLKLITNILGQPAADAFAKATLIEYDYSFQNLFIWGLNCILVFLILPAILIKFVLKEKLSDYGFQLSGIRKHIWIYILLISIMVPIVFFISKSPAFLQKYPFYHITNSAQLKRFLVWEIIYILQFISIEFFFRGFLVLALVQICGPHCIIPIACFYCTIHLGKPMGEAISSFFGGMLLGIITLNTGSIWGGLIVHLGIAWMMEIGGWLGRHFKG